MPQRNEYVVRVSTYGRMFEEPTEEYHPSADSGPTTLAKAWAYKSCWERDHQGSEPIAEVIHLPTGRVAKDPLFPSSLASSGDGLADISLGLSVLIG